MMRGQHHPAIIAVICKLKNLELHASRAGREVFEALIQVGLDSQTQDSRALIGEIEQAIDALLEVMPAYAPPLNAILRVSAVTESGLKDELSVEEFKGTLTEERDRFRRWSQEVQDKTSHLGAELIHSGQSIFTFTYGETVMRVFRQAAGQGKSFRVKVTESRPNNDGLETACTLAELGLMVELSVDACMAELISGCDLMMVGAEAITAEGGAVCKVGTYPAALLAKANNIPVYIVVDSSKFNLLSLYAIPLIFDPLRRQDVLPENDHVNVNVVGHLFDETPQELISALVTERGIIPSAASSALMREMPFSSAILEKLTAWSLYKSN